MSINALEEMYSDEVKTAEPETDNITSIERNMVVSTPMFDITFKKFKFQDNEINSSRGLMALDLFNFVDKLVVQIARENVELRRMVFGEEALADDVAPTIKEMFNSTGTLKEEYKTSLTEAQIQRAETTYALLVGYLETIRALANARTEFFSGARSSIQYAYNAEARKGISDLKEAIEYRIKTNPQLRELKKRVSKRREGGKEIEALHYGSVSDILNF